MNETNIFEILLNDITINPRQRQEPVQESDIAALAESIRTIGLINPIVLDPGNVLIAGETRIKAFRLLGRTEIPAIYKANLSDFQKRVMELEENIRRFPLTYPDKLRAELELHRMYTAERGKVKTLGGEGRDLWRLEDTAALLGISAAAVSQHLQLAQAIEKEPDLANMKTEKQARNELKRREATKLRQALALIETVKRQTVSPTGTSTTPQIEPDKYTFELATLYKGDCLTIIPQLPDDSVSCLITDPPWQVEYDARFGSPTDTGLDLTQKMLVLLKPKLKNGALCWLFCATKHILPGTIYNLIKSAGYEPPTQLIIWCKDGLAHSDHPFRSVKNDYEIAVLFTKNTARDFLAPIFALHHGRVDDKVHPAQKAEAVITHLIEVSTTPGELLIDPFAGSGVVLKCANQLKRQAIGVEKESSWYATTILNLTGSQL